LKKGQKKPGHGQAPKQKKKLQGVESAATDKKK